MLGFGGQNGIAQQGGGKGGGHGRCIHVGSTMVQGTTGGAGKVSLPSPGMHGVIKQLLHSAALFKVSRTVLKR